MNVSWDLKNSKLNVEEFEKWLAKGVNPEKIYVFNFQNILQGSLFSNTKSAVLAINQALTKVFMKYGRDKY